MGKRELLIVAAFVAMAVAVYEWTAPRAPAGSTRFSISRLVDNVRRAHGSGGTGSVTHTGTLPVSAALTELRVSGVTRLTVAGENRNDVAYTLQIDASGPDNASALDAAERTTLRPDDLGRILSIDVAWPPPDRAGRGPGRPPRLVTRLTLHVPARLGVHVDGSRDLDVSNVAWVALGSLVGDVRLTAIAGSVTGAHRNGKLAIDGAHGVTLSLVSSETTLARVGGPIGLLARSGQVHVDAPAGPVAIDATNEDITIADAMDHVLVDGSGGHLTIDRPRGETTVDVRSTTVDVTIDHPAAVTAFAADAPLRLVVDGAPAVAIDARATDGGAITATGVDAPVRTDGGTASLVYAFTDGATTRVALRNRHAPIVIDQRK
ncbi:MAG TPA: hypothetical protein VG538_07070 [Vicinamibacterales bacterium]|nr:hypothetical protein [Vicinamibacterales bacterium]